jgi:hypothetical protein
MPGRLRCDFLSTTTFIIASYGEGPGPASLRAADRADGFQDGFARASVDARASAATPATKLVL